nr:hypothetical protein [Streptomyces xiamenensis]
MARIEDPGELEELRRGPVVVAEHVLLDPLDHLIRHGAAQQAPHWFANVQGPQLLQKPHEPIALADEVGEVDLLGHLAPHPGLHTDRPL